VFEGTTGVKLGIAALVGVAALALVFTSLAGADPNFTYVPGPQIYAEATNSSGAFVSFSFPQAISDIYPHNPVPVRCDHYGGEFFFFGLTHVVCYATDATITRGASFEVIVQDTTPPSITIPSDVTLEANGPGGRVISYNATAYDVVDGGRPVSCSNASGTVFPIGTTTVTCTSTDSHGNTGTKSFKVTITDTTPPVLGGSPGDQTAEATSSSGAAVSFTTPGATDLVDGALTSTCAPASGSTFALGQTKVTCTATDKHGNASSLSFNVTVRDTTPPALTVPANKTVKKGAKVRYSATATDAVDGAVTPSCKPASGTVFKVGTTTVKCTATDAAGNSASKSFKVTVKR